MPWENLRRQRECYEQALAIRRDVKDRRGEGDTLSNLGKLYRKKGQSEKANERYEQSVAISRELGDRLVEAHRLYNMAELSAGLSKLADAMKTYQQALTIYEDLKESKWQAAALMNMGHIHKEDGRLDKALGVSGKRSPSTVTLMMRAACASA